MWSVRVGAEYDVNENWKLRFGYVWDQSPIRDEFRGPEMPGEDRHMLCVGCGYRTDRWAIDTAYSYLMTKNASSNISEHGDYDTVTHLLSLSFSYKF